MDKKFIIFIRIVLIGATTNFLRYWYDGDLNWDDI